MALPFQSTANETGFNHCEIAAAIVNTSGYRLIVIATLLIAIPGFLFNVLLVLATIRVSIFHPNLRLLLVHSSLVLALAGFSSIIGLVLFLVRISIMHPCQLVIRADDCAWQELPFSMPQAAISFSSMIICVERIYASVKHRDYDNDSEKPWLAIVLVALCWLTGGAFALGFLYANYNNDAILPVCDAALSLRPSEMTISLVTLLLFEILTLVFTLGLRLYNKRQLHLSLINRNSETLSSRFQLQQNVHMNEMITPTALFQAICYAPGLIFLAFIVQGYQMSPSTNEVIVKVTYLWRIMHISAAPLFALVYNQPLKVRVWNWLPKVIQRVLKQQFKVAPVKAPVEQGAAEMARDHFKMLEEMWKVPVKVA